MRNRSKNDYLTLPFPRIDGKPHPAYEELKRQAELLSLMPYGLDRGSGPYAAALLIDRDMRLRPQQYPHLPSVGLWFPSTMTLKGREQPETLPSPSSSSYEDQQKAAAKRAAQKWRVDEEED